MSLLVRSVALLAFCVLVITPPHALGAPPGLKIRSAQAVPLRRSIFELTDEIDVSRDCPVRSVLGKKTPICDLAPAFQRTFERCEPELGKEPRGCVITIAPGTYELRQPQRICRPHVIRGAGGGAFNPATHIYTPDGMTPFRFAAMAECMGDNQPGAGGAEISGLAIEAYAHTSTTPFYGLLIEASVIVEHVWVRRYVQGIRINAGARRKKALASNANCWWLSDVWVDQSAHSGIHVDGPDTNAGLALRPVATSNCQEAKRFEATLGPCANVFAGDFLGSTVVAGHTATAKDLQSGQIFPGYVLGDSPNSRGVCLGCYGEMDQAPSLLGRKANAFGGMTSWSGSGWFMGTEVGGLSLLNDRDPKNAVRIRLGNLAPPGTYLELAPPVDSALRWPLRLSLDLKRQAFRFDVGGLNRAVPLLIGAAERGDLELGAVKLQAPADNQPAPRIQKQ